MREREAEGGRERERQTDRDRDRERALRERERDRGTGRERQSKLTDKRQREEDPAVLSPWSLASLPPPSLQRREGRGSGCSSGW